MSEIPTYPDECEHGNTDDTCRICDLEFSVFALTTVLRDIRRKGLTEELRNEIDMLIEPDNAGGDRTPQDPPRGT